MYVMPLDEKTVFLEETMLVGRPSVSFEECKRRLDVRLEHLGIKIKRVSIKHLIHLLETPE